MKRLLIALQNLLRQPGEKPRLLLYWFLVYSFLILVPNLGFIIEVLFNQTILTLRERMQLVFSLYTNALQFLTEPVTLSIILLSVLLALNFLVIGYIRKRNQQQKGRFRSTVAMLVSSHCVACGGSLLAPVISLLGGGTIGTFSFSSTRYLQLQLLTLTLNAIAMAITLRSMYKATDTLLVLTSTPRGYTIKS